MKGESRVNKNDQNDTKKCSYLLLHNCITASESNEIGNDRLIILASHNLSGPCAFLGLTQAKYSIRNLGNRLAPTTAWITLPASPTRLGAPNSLSLERHLDISHFLLAAPLASNVP